MKGLKKEKRCWRELLINAVREPAMMHDCYRLFHKYSIGNQILALLECKARNIQPGPLAPIDVGRNWAVMSEKARKLSR